MKRIREEILNRCSSIEASYVVYYTSLLSPPVGVRRLCTHPPCTIKGGRPLEKDSSPAGQRIDSFILRAIHHTVDVGYYAPAARTTLKSVCSCVLTPKLDRPNRLALPRVPPSGNRRVRSATRLWVPPKAHDIWRRPWGSPGVGRIFRFLGCVYPLQRRTRR